MQSLNSSFNARLLNSWDHRSYPNIQCSIKSKFFKNKNEDTICINSLEGTSSKDLLTCSWRSIDFNFFSCSYSNGKSVRRVGYILNSFENGNGNGFTGSYPRPKRIILVRHGESEGNVDETAYTRIPDSKIALTQNGWNQAVNCGKKIRKIIEDDEAEDWKIYCYVSPYLRTLQTLKGIGINFERERLAGVREEPRLREQDFGNFQCRERMRVEKEIRLRYGRFFYRFPDGESAADVYDRVTGFRETLKSDIDTGRFQKLDDCHRASRNTNLLIVSHGLTLRVFLMRWYKWTVQQFQGLYNLNNTGMLVMQLGPGGRYSLTVHHSREELKAFGMTEAMIDDQDWQMTAKPGELNKDWSTAGTDFFDHFDFLESGKIKEYKPQGLSVAEHSQTPVVNS